MTRSWYRYLASRVRMARRHLRLSLLGGLLVVVIRAILRVGLFLHYGGIAVKIYALACNAPPAAQKN